MGKVPVITCHVAPPSLLRNTPPPAEQRGPGIALTFAVDLVQFRIFGHIDALGVGRSDGDLLALFACAKRAGAEIDPLEIRLVATPYVGKQA